MKKFYLILVFLFMLIVPAVTGAICLRLDLNLGALGSFGVPSFLTSEGENFILSDGDIFKVQE